MVNINFLLKNIYNKYRIVLGSGKCVDSNSGIKGIDVLLCKRKIFFFNFFFFWFVGGRSGYMPN